MCLLTLSTTTCTPKFAMCARSDCTNTNRCLCVLLGIIAAVPSSPLPNVAITGTGQLISKRLPSLVAILTLLIISLTGIAVLLASAGTTLSSQSQNVSGTADTTSYKANFSCQMISITFETKSHRSHHTYLLLEIKARQSSLTLSVSLTRCSVVSLICMRLVYVLSL